MIDRKYDQAQVAMRGKFLVKIDQDLSGEGGRSKKWKKKILTVVVLASVVVVGRVASKVCCTCISRTKWIADV
jgi:hypothetical protein